MKRILTIIATASVLFGCKAVEETPYAASLCTLQVNVVWPEDDADIPHGKIAVKAEDVNRGHIYRDSTDLSGQTAFKLTKGLYRISVSEKREELIFNGTADKVPVTSANDSLTLKLGKSKSGTIIIKEIYCGGCMKTPEEGTYQMDQYVIVHNNDFKVQYLDSLCFGTLFPYNAIVSNPFISRDEEGNIVYPDFAPIAQCIWRFPGNGTTFPLQPGEDAVICLRGAIDHSASFPLSVNLNREGYFVCYNSTYFTNPKNHPVPGDRIDPSRYLEVVIKTGIATAYTFSNNSPTALLFKLKSVPEEVSIPGNSKEKAAAVSYDDVIDAVEVFNGTSSSNAKRLKPELDAGYVTLSKTYLGHSLMRRVDEALTASSGYEVLTDTNNSSNDFYERETQSLHD